MSPDTSLLTMLLDRLLESSNATLSRLERMDQSTGQRLDRIDTRLADGDSTLTHLAQRVTRLEQRPRRSTMAQTIGAVEKLTKRWATGLVWLIALWASGSLEIAAKVVAVLPK